MRVLVVEDHERTREAIVRVLRQREPSWELCDAGDIPSALRACAPKCPQVALVDLRLGDTSGATLVKELSALGVRCLMLTISDHEGDVRDALQAGARGYLLKSESPVRIIEALKELMRGDAPLSSKVAKYLLPAGGPATPPPEHNLTERELEVLRQLAAGATYAACADELGIKLGTVQSHVKSIYAKLGVSSKTEACAWALRAGLAS